MYFHANLTEGSTFFEVWENFSFYNALIHVMTLRVAYSKEKEPCKM